MWFSLFKILAPHAYVIYYQARRLSGHTSPYGEYACFLKHYTFWKSKVGTLHQERNLFLLKAPCILRTTYFIDADVDQLSFELVKILLQLFGWFSCWSKKLKTVCYIIIHGARGLAVGVPTPIPLWLDLGQETWPITRQFEASSNCSKFRARKQDVEIKQNSSRLE